MVEKSDCIVYILRADQRDYLMDTRFINEILSTKNKVIIGMNYVDKIEPISRKAPFSLTRRQLINIRAKVNVYLKDLVFRKKIVPYSATEFYGLNKLVVAMLNNLIKRIYDGYNQLFHPTASFQSGSYNNRFWFSDKGSYRRLRLL